MPACQSADYLITNLVGYDVALKKFDGRDHLVVPVVMLTEGVHSGSGGPLFYPSDEIGKFPTAWNGRPTPVFHPADENGFPISCNSPDVLEAQNVGQVFNSRYMSGKLAAQLWIDVERLSRVDPELLQRINAREPIEVSTGLFLDVDGQAGEWNGEKYLGIARNFRPDHLALLPVGNGACSLDDGCGIRANSKNDQHQEENTTGGDDMKKKDMIEFLTSNGCKCTAEQLDKADAEMLAAMVETLQEGMTVNDSLVQERDTAAERIAALEAENDELKTKLEDAAASNPTGNQDQVPPEPPATVDEYVANAPPEMAAVLNRALARDRQLKTDLVERLAANQKVFTKEELQSKSLGELEKLNALSAPKGDYTLSGARPANPGPTEEEPMLAPTFNFGK